MESEKRLIDANGKQTINAVDLTGFILCFSDGIISVIDRFGSVACKFYTEDIPTVDAVEVVHGRWEETTEADDEFGEMYFYKCSVCGQLRWFKTNYCPNCGAKMDGDGNG